ncbi:MAG: hypothetical protein OER86_13605, partial [Phycisphaerae bacterium]|nr:hypothetical protein [Phycisphaerae bacterium]
MTLPHLAGPFASCVARDAPTSMLHRLKQLLQPDHLHNLALRRGAISTLADQVAVIREHLRSRDKQLRPAGERPRVFLAVRPGGWESAGLIDTWAQVAEVVPMDYDPAWDPYARSWMAKGRVAFRQALLEQVHAAHGQAPLDLFFGYLSGGWTDPAAIESINQLGPITANISFDDSHRFWGRPRRGFWTGSATLAPAFDLCTTLQDPRDAQKYRYVGARPLHLLPGGNEAVFAQGEPAEQRDVP